MLTTDVDFKTIDANMALWYRFEKTDPAMTKPFKAGGGFKGTSINHVWSVKQMTDAFGPLGRGWGTEILDEKILVGAPLDDQGTRSQVHLIRLKMWFKHAGQVGEIVRLGTTMFVGRNRFGIFTDEEAAKKSYTDALSKCMYMLGIGADVMLGEFEDNKLSAAEPPASRQESAEKKEPPKGRAPPAAKRPGLAGEKTANLDRLLGLCGTDRTEFLNYFRRSALHEFTDEQYDEAVQRLESKLRKLKKTAA